MRRILLSILLVLFAFYSLKAQNASIEGIVVDADNGGALIGTNVLIKGTNQGVITDVDGKFKIGNLSEGKHVVEINYIGYENLEMDAFVMENETVNLGKIQLLSAPIGLQEIEVIASYATDRKTPIAFSTIDSKKIETRTGNQEFVEILREAPSVYVTKQGGGFGDSRINVRGFDQRNTAVMINGVPVNDMENGWVYWSNWAGLTDVASSVQYQRGLGATKLAVPTVGGSINIVTNAAEREKGGYASISIGNDGYTKYGLALSTGLSKSGWALTVQGTHTRGDGYADGTLFRAYSYFASIAKKFNSAHTLNFSVVGAPQWHFQREYGSYDGVTIESIKGNEITGATGRGIKYNPQWGFYSQGEYKDDMFSWRKNFYHKPKMFLNHYWTISERTDLATSAYASFGRGGGTGDLGRINGRYRTDSRFKDENGIVRWNDIQSWNTGNTVGDFGADQVPWSGSGVTTEDPGYNGPFAGQGVAESWRNGMILRSSMNEHNWYGIISNLTHELTSNWTLVTGIDARYYKGLHYRRVEDLMGLDAYFDDDDINVPEKYITDEGRADDNQIDYNNDGLVNWLGLYGQLEYSTDKISAFLSLSGSNQGFKRIDYFLYEDDDPEQSSDWQNFLGGTAKTGINYNINDHHNVFVNAGYLSRQPIFDNVFLNFSNDINTDVKNQEVYALELGYGLRGRFLKANVNLYHTYWGNRQISRGSRQTLNEIGTGNPIQVDGNANYEGINQLHQGIEVDFVAQPVERLSINGMFSYGNWRYTDDFSATWTPEDAEYQDQTRELTLFMTDVKVPDAAQMTFSLGATFELIKGLNLYADYFYYDKLYADFDLASDNSFLTAGNQAWKLPSYGLLGAGVYYNFKLGSLKMSANVNVNNVLDTEYISESETNRLYDPEDAEDVEIGDNGSISNIAYYGFGRTWNAGLKIQF